MKRLLMLLAIGAVIFAGWVMLASVEKQLAVAPTEKSGTVLSETEQ